MTLCEEADVQLLCCSVGAAGFVKEVANGSWVCDHYQGRAQVGDAPKHETRNQNPKPGIRNPRFDPWAPRQHTRNPNPKPQTLNPKPYRSGSKA